MTDEEAHVLFKNFGSIWSQPGAEDNLKDLIIASTPRQSIHIGGIAGWGKGSALGKTTFASREK